jgi:hypothetical protein
MTTICIQIIFNLAVVLLFVRFSYAEYEWHIRELTIRRIAAIWNATPKLVLPFKPLPRIDIVLNITKL